jgi:uncharacterized RDD family membrane protein YckC
MTVDEQVAVLAPETQRFARMGDRVCAMFLDFIVLFPLFWLVIAVIGVANGVYKGGNADLVGGPALLAFLIITVVWIAFYLFTEYFFEGSPGKYVMGIKVTSLCEGRITIPQAVARNLLRPVDAVGFYLLGFVVAICSKQRQRIGDLAAGTVVVEMPEARRINPLLILIASIIPTWGAVYFFQQFAQ